MPYPNSDLAMWQLIVIGVVPVLMLVIWLIAIYLADRQPRKRAASAAGSPAEAAVPGATVASGDRVAA
jgi:hypothetical protein